MESDVEKIKGTSHKVISLILKVAAHFAIMAAGQVALCITKFKKTTYSEIVQSIAIGVISVTPYLSDKERFILVKSIDFSRIACIVPSRIIKGGVSLFGEYFVKKKIEKKIEPHVQNFVDDIIDKYFLFASSRIDKLTQFQQELDTTPNLNEIEKFLKILQITFGDWLLSYSNPLLATAGIALMNIACDAITITRLVVSTIKETAVNITAFIIPNFVKEWIQNSLSFISNMSGIAFATLNQIKNFFWKDRIQEQKEIELKKEIEVQKNELKILTELAFELCLSYKENDLRSIALTYLVAQTTEKLFYNQNKELNTDEINEKIKNNSPTTELLNEVKKLKINIINDAVVSLLIQVKKESPPYFETLLHYDDLRIYKKDQGNYQKDQHYTTEHEIFILDEEAMIKAYSYIYHTDSINKKTFDKGSINSKSSKILLRSDSLVESRMILTAGGSDHYIKDEFNLKKYNGNIDLFKQYCAELSKKYMS